MCVWLDDAGPDLPSPPVWGCWQMRRRHLSEEPMWNPSTVSHRNADLAANESVGLPVTRRQTESAWACDPGLVVTGPGLVILGWWLHGLGQRAAWGIRILIGAVVRWPQAWSICCDFCTSLKVLKVDSFEHTVPEVARRCNKDLFVFPRDLNMRALSTPIWLQFKNVCFKEQKYKIYPFIIGAVFPSDPKLLKVFLSEAF